MSDVRSPRVVFSVLFSHPQLETGYLKHVIETFEKLGYARVNGSEDQDWDVLWSHDYPFGGIITHELEPHQRVNKLLSVLQAQVHDHEP